MTRPSGTSETPSGRKGWVRNSNGKPNNWATNLSPSNPRLHNEPVQHERVRWKRIRLLSRMSSGEATLRIRMQHARSGNPPLNETVDAIPVGPVLLTPTDQCSPPEPCHPFAKCAQTVDVSRYRVV